MEIYSVNSTESRESNKKSSSKILVWLEPRHFCYSSHAYFVALDIESILTLLKVKPMQRPCIELFLRSGTDELAHIIT